MNDDEPWEDLFAKLREIEPPASVRAGNRAAMRAATALPATQGWLHRSVATPLPAMFALAALLVVSLSLNFVLWRGRPAATETTAPAEVGEAASPAGDRRSPSIRNLAMSEPQVEYSETQRYLSGVGVVDRRVSYVFKGLP